MNTDLSPEAVEYGRTARRALEAVGGDELVQAGAGERDGGDAAAKVLADLGAWDLDPRGSAEELEAAAVLCRSAGWWAVPHPVAERLARPRDVEVDALVVVAGTAPPGAIAESVSACRCGGWPSTSAAGAAAARRGPTRSRPGSPASRFRSSSCRSTTASRWRR